MYAYPRDYQQFYGNQRHWEEVHHPLPTQYNLYDESNYYYHPDHSNYMKYGNDNRRYDGNRRKEEAYRPNTYCYDEEDDENNDFFYYQHDSNGHFTNRHGARSASPLKRKNRKRRHHHKSGSGLPDEAWTQPTPFVNHQPVILDPMMNLQQQILGTCATDTMMPTANFGPTSTNTYGMLPQGPQPVPMINHTQPYFIQMPSAANFPPATFAPSNAFCHQQQQPMFPFVHPMPPQSLFNDLFSNLTLGNDKADPVESDQVKAEDTNTAVEQKQVSPTKETASAPSTPLNHPIQRPLRRRRSMMETVLSSFSLLGDNQNSAITNRSSWDPSAYMSLNEALKPGTNKGNNDLDAKNDSAISSSLSPRSSASASAANDEGNATLSRRDSLKLSQKMNALQSRQFIWCYKPQNEEAALWAAFDMKNQRKLDHHYAKLIAKKNQLQQQQQEKENDKEAAAETASNLPDDIITLSKQSQLHGPVMVSLSKATAWCFDNDSSFSLGSGGQKHVLFDVACLPSQQNRFVVSNQLVSKDPVVRRSKSVDGGLATKFINSVLKW